MPVLVCLVLALVAAPLAAAPPTLTNLTPRGAERGKPVEVVIAGTNLTPQTRFVLPFPATQAVVPDTKPNPTQVRIRLTVDAAVPLGIYPIRVLTEDGVSALALFAVDSLPGVNETEDNNTFEKAQKVTFPVVVNGQCAGGDVDFFRFTARKGQRVVAEVESARLGSGVLPQMRATDALKRLLAADDTQGRAGDGRVWFEAPADGDYVVEVSDSRYRGGAPPHYRLRLGEYDAIEEIFPLGGRRGETVAFTLRGGTLAGETRVQQALAPTAGLMLLNMEGTAKPGTPSLTIAVGELPELIRSQAGAVDAPPANVTPPLVINGRMDRKGAVERFRFPVQAGQRYRVAVQAERLGSLLDGVLRVSDQNGKQLVLVDDVDVPPLAAGQQASKSADPAADVAVPAGTTALVVELRDQRGRGGINFGYRLTIKPVLADYTLVQPTAEVNAPRGGSVALVIPVIRRDFPGPIQLSVPGLPPGVTVQGGHVPAGATVGALTLTTAAEAPALPEPLALSVVGVAAIDGREVRREAVQKIPISRDPGFPGPTMLLTRFAFALTGPAPFAVEGPKTIELVKGYPATVLVQVKRAKDQAALAVEVTGVTPTRPAAPGQPAQASLLVAKPATAAAGAGNARFALTAAANAPEGRVADLLVQGKARIGNADRIEAGPAVPVTIHRPFTVELSAPELALTPGESVVLKGQLQRQSVFKEPVQIKLDGLPKGITLAAPLKPIAAGSSDFQLDLRVDPKAVLAAGNLTLTFSTTIGSMAYVHPPVVVAVKPGK